MQFATDTDLADALAAPVVSMRPLLEFDWQRDGTFTTNSYDDLSDLVSSVDADFPSLHSDLPSEINTVVGSSSGIMTVRLSGVEGVSGLFATQLWSKYYVPSPLYTYTKEGTPVRYSRIVQTKTGPRTIRQFTGWVVEYLLDEATDTVTLTCSDVYDLQTSLVSLPVWARGPDASSSNSPGPSGLVSSMTCIDANWVYKEVLRQSGRSIWPVPRSDCLAMWSCDGSMLPSVGAIGCAINVNGPQFQSALGGDDFLPYELSGQPYGISPSGVSGTQTDDLTMGFARSVSTMNVPDRGSGDPARYIGFAGWVKSYGSPGALGAPSMANILLGSIGSDSGYLQLMVYPGGSFALNLRESGLSGSSNAGTTRTYSWVSAGNSVPGGGGGSPAWHYLEVWMNFTNSSIAVVAKIDGATVAPTASPASTAAFKYYLTFTFEEETNQCYLEFHDTSMQHVQVFGGNGTAASVAGQKDPPYVTNGRTRPARTSMLTNYLTHIPDRFNKNGWDILREAVEGELGVLITREDGSVWMMGREDAYFYGWLPTMGNNLSSVINQAFEMGLSLSWFSLNTDLATDPVQDLSRSKISGLQYNPSADTYRHAIGYHVDLTKSINAIVWSSSDPKQFYAASGTTNLSRTVGLPSGTISIYNNVVDVGITPNSNKPPLDQTSIAAVDAGNPANPATSGWLASVFWLLGQRSFRFGWGAGILSPGPVYVGSAQNNDQSSFQIGGWKYDNSDSFDEVWYRTSEVASRGYVLLDLGSNDWRQFPPKLRKIFDGLLRDTIAAVPVMRNLSVPLDPRRQLLDVVKLPASRIVSGDVYAQVVGKRISDTKDSAQDFIDVRVVSGPAQAAYWDVAKWNEGSWTL